MSHTILQTSQYLDFDLVQLCCISKQCLFSPKTMTLPLYHVYPNTDSHLSQAAQLLQFRLAVVPGYSLYWSHFEKI